MGRFLPFHLLCCAGRSPSPGDRVYRFDEGTDKNLAPDVDDGQLDHLIPFIKAGGFGVKEERMRRQPPAAGVDHARFKQNSSCGYISVCMVPPRVDYSSSFI